MLTYPPLAVGVAVFTNLGLKMFKANRYTRLRRPQALIEERLPHYYQKSDYTKLLLHGLQCTLPNALTDHPEFGMQNTVSFHRKLRHSNDRKYPRIVIFQPSRKFQLNTQMRSLCAYHVELLSQIANPFATSLQQRPTYQDTLQ